LTSSEEDLGIAVVSTTVCHRSRWRFGTISRQRCVLRGVCVLVLAGCGLFGGAGRGAEPEAAKESEPRELELLNAEEWRQLDFAVDHGLEFLSRTQRPDGSFEAPDVGQPGITSLCVMAFLSRGHVPEEGLYGDQLARAIDFVLDTQQESGLLFKQKLRKSDLSGPPINPTMYNHAMAGLMLCEVYGMTDDDRRERVAAVVTRAVDFTRERQLAPKRHPRDQGGWRYLGNLSRLANDADLTVTSWQLMFLRSARNAEFDVPGEIIDEAMRYVRRSFESNEGVFTYTRVNPGHYTNRAIMGCGILSLSLGGEHQSDMARTAGDWILSQDFDRYNQPEFPEERYHYSAYYCSQAMFQLGGQYWTRFFPAFQGTLVANQQPDGSWSPEVSYDRQYGNSYTTALVILSLTPPYQLLPIYQR
jgi:hypothetical protein